MARSDDDGTSTGDGDTYTRYTLDDATAEDGGKRRLLSRVFAGCEDDALGSVHRAWAVTVLFMVLFFVIACFEATKLADPDFGPSLALRAAAYWSAFVHLIVAISGTFVLKRFSTAFTIGCFLGTVAVLSQQDLLLFAAFYKYPHGSVAFNLVFADLALALSCALGFFGLILGHFRHHIIVR